MSELGTRRWAWPGSIRELRDRLSRYLERVRDGEEIIGTDRGAAFARVLPIEQPRPSDRLVADGIIQPSKPANGPARRSA